ncbi:glycoside hydrolase family 28 protein, partial [Rhizoctonia solani]
MVIFRLVSLINTSDTLGLWTLIRLDNANERPCEKYPRNICTLTPGGAGVDDSQAILEAFSQCGQNGHVVFQNATYHIERVMNTTGLTNCTVDIRGTLLWGTDVQYWLKNSLPLGYQNQSSAWFLGGTNLNVQGFGHGTFDGNGQVRYDYAAGISNLKGRPHALIIWNTKNSTFQGIRFVQSQMWVMTVAQSEDVILEDIYVSIKSNSSAGTRNTDGANTLASNRITFRNWEVNNGDDSIAIKANSTNILMENMVLQGGNGVAIGSIGQYNGVYEYIENVVARNISCIRTNFASYIKTWTGIQQGYPPNGGGGGKGVVRNLVFSDFSLSRIRSMPVQVTQCTSFQGATGGCDTSTLQISNITWGPMTGTTNYDVLAQLQCSAAAVCKGLRFETMSGIKGNSTSLKINCSNVENSIGFNCTGSV